MTDAGWVIDELTLPTSTDDPRFNDFAAMVAVRNAIETATIGTDVLNVAPADLLPTYLNQEHSPRRVFVARAGEAGIVGRAVLEWSTEPGSTAAWPSVEVTAGHRGRGIGSALLSHAETEALALGLRTFQTFATHAPLAGGDRMPSPTGYGDLPARDPGVGFLTHHGYELEQVARISALTLPPHEATLSRCDRDAHAAAGGTYRVLRWVGRTPGGWLDDIATLRNRMSTDAPAAGLEMVEEAWDADRVRTSEERGEVSDRTVLTVAAEHVPSGRLAGFSQLVIPGDRSRPVSQEDTLVMREHRGHRLGMLLKVANLRHLGEVHPAATLVTTFNAEENRHMLAVNEALGFRALGYEGGWKKVVPPG